MRVEQTVLVENSSPFARQYAGQGVALMIAGAGILGFIGMQVLQESGGCDLIQQSR
jgi:hypothetical protein